MGFIVIAAHLQHIPHSYEWEIPLVCPIRSYFAMHTYYRILTTKWVRKNYLSANSDAKNKCKR